MNNIIVIIGFLAGVAGLVSNINEIISIPKNLKEIFQKTFKRNHSPDDFSYYFESQKGLINSKLQEYHKRVIYDQNGNEITDIVADIIDKCSLSKGEYIFFEGNKKIGKTVIAAHIVNVLKCCHHFISISENLNDKELIVKSIIEQIYKKIKRKCPDLRENRELSPLLGSSLTLLSEYAQNNKKSEYIIIDGIELLESNWLEVLPNYLPNGVYILVFGRYNSLSDNAKSYKLKPFKLSETKSMLTSITLSEAEINEVHSELEGHPYKISYFVNKYNQNISFKKQINDAQNSLEIDKILASLSQEGQMLFFLLSIIYAPITCNDIINIFDKNRAEIQSLLTTHQAYILNDSDGVRLIDDEIKIFINNTNSLTNKEKNEIKSLHKNIVDYFKSRNCDYSKKYLIYHYYKAGDHDSTIKILLDNTDDEEIQNERRKFVNLIIEENSEKNNIILGELISQNSGIFWNYLFDALRYILDNNQNYQLVNKVINQIDNSLLSDENKKITQYFKSVCMRKEGRIEDAKNCLSNIDRKDLRAPFDILILIQLADCSRELGEVLQSIELYSLVVNFPNCREDYPKEYWECKLKIIDRMYCDGLYVQTINNITEAKKECRRLLLYDLLLKLYKEEAQVYNDLCMYDKTIEVLEHNALELCKLMNNKGMKGELYNLLSIAEIIQNPHNGKKTAEEAIEINDKVGSIVEKGKSILSLGISFYIGKDYPQAEKRLLEALSLFETVCYRSGIAKVEHELGKVLFKYGKIHEAKEHLRKSKELFVRDYGITHKIYEYKNVIVESIIDGKEINNDTFATCENIEFILKMDSFIQAYKKEVIN